MLHHKYRRSSCKTAMHSVISFFAESPSDVGSAGLAIKTQPKWHEETVLDRSGSLIPLPAEKNTHIQWGPKVWD